MSLARFLLLSSLVMISQWLPGQTTRYVSTAGNDNNAGTSWATAYRSIQKAIQVAAAGDQVWVAQGVYYCDEAPGASLDNRELEFYTKANMTIYGGFNNESSPAQRNLLLNFTILSGEIQQDGIQTNNSKRVINGGSLSSVVLDGLVISDGYNDAGETSGVSLSGVFNNSSLTLRNCHIRE